MLTFNLTNNPVLELNMLEFKPSKSHFDFVIGIESASADAIESNALAYMDLRKAVSFGNATVLVGKFKRTKVRAFAVDYYLYVLRTDMDTQKTRIFQYYAPHGILLIEASKIAEWHHKTHVDF